MSLILAMIEALRRRLRKPGRQQYKLDIAPQAGRYDLVQAARPPNSQQEGRPSLLWRFPSHQRFSVQGDRQQRQLQLGNDFVIVGQPAQLWRWTQEQRGLVDGAAGTGEWDAGRAERPPEDARQV
uniref:(northern house mosquito) hypothetical protein n=1 Tax=Culex pipiens TaxID=7175 RepID=A0A8D8C3Q0_CULPI